MEYRKDLDGLRALSIIFVVLFHSEVDIFNQIFRGGFIGVDIFFVLSGYLITGVLINNYKKNRDIKLFYLKRARRLLPAFYILIFFTIILSYFFLISNYYDEFFGSVIASTSIISNFFFAFNSSYFDTPYFLKPLLHTWSLAIEFQFIIFYPIFLFFCLKYLSKKNLIYLLLFICFINLLYVQLGGNLQFAYPFIENNIRLFNPPTAGTFFYTTSRIWEFFIGAICFFLNNKSLKLSNIFYYVGISLILFSLILFSKQIDNPGINNSIPVFGTCLILLSNKANNLIKRILSLKYIVFIGLISYSLYLIHFPIISFSKYIIIDNSYINENYFKLFLIILSFILSIFSWRYIEKPFRNSKKISNKFFLKFIFLILILILLSNQIVKNLKKNEEFLIKQKYNHINFNLENDVKLFGKNDFFSKNKKKILILGDSQSVDLFKVFRSNKKLVEKFEFSYFDSKFEFHYLSENTKIAKKFKDNLITSKKFLLSDYIIIVSDYSNKDLNSFDKNIIFLKKFDKKIIISNSFPNFSIHSPIISILLKNNKKLLSNKEINLELFSYIKKQAFNNNKYLDLKTKQNNLILFDRSNLICDFKKKTCPSLNVENKLVFLDYRHLTDIGAKYVSESKYLLNFFKNLEN